MSHPQTNLPFAYQLVDDDMSNMMNMMNMMRRNMLFPSMGFSDWSDRMTRGHCPHQALRSNVEARQCENNGQSNSQDQDNQLQSGETTCNDNLGNMSLSQMDMTELKPWMNTREHADRTEIVTAMPGVPKENVEVSLETTSTGTYLRVSGRNTVEESEDQENEHWSKIMRSSYSNCVRVPDGTTESDVSARYENGVLHVDVKKHLGDENQSKVRRVNVV